MSLWHSTSGSADDDDSTELEVVYASSVVARRSGTGFGNILTPRPSAARSFAAIADSPLAEWALEIVYGKPLVCANWLCFCAGLWWPPGEKIVRQLPSDLLKLSFGLSTNEP